MKILKSRLDHINKYTMKNNFLILTTMLIFFGVYSQERIITADTSKVTKHSTTILNKKVNYSAQIGTQPIWDVDGEVIATLHYTYYRRTDIDDNSYYLAKGSYKLLITVNNNSIEKEFKIK